MDEFRTADGCVTLSLAGTFTSGHVPETRTKLEELQQQGYIVDLDLRELRLIDRDGIAMLIWATAVGTHLNNAPRYILAWITQEARHNRCGCD